MKKAILSTMATALFVLPLSLNAQISSADFEGSPTYSDHFAGGSSTMNWIIDPDAAAAVTNLVPPSFVTATPGGIDSDIVADDPVASSTDGGVMLVGANQADIATNNFGLNYVIADNSANGGGGDDLTLLTDYKVVARVWCLGTSEYTTLGDQDRWAGGPYLHAGSGGGDLFRASTFYQVGATGAGPGFYTRGLSTGATLTTTPLTNGRWVLMEIMVSGDTVGAGYDANNDGTIDEGDSAEFDGNLARDTGDTAQGAPGINMVGEVTNDVYPLFVDYVEVYLATSDVNDWTLY